MMPNPAGSRHRLLVTHPKCAQIFSKLSFAPIPLRVKSPPFPNHKSRMRIGPHLLRNNLIVAPMAGVTDRPFRQLCKRMGAGMAVSEMVTSNSLLYGSEKTRRRADHQGEVAPISVQIAGADPAMMALAARRNVDNGAQIIDINMGCPAKKVCNVMAGSALLQNEPLVGRILEAVVKAVPEVPVTLKTRTGWDKASKNTLAVLKIAQESGIQALALHGRTRACGYTGSAEYDTVKAVKAEARIPIIANGDITTPEKAKFVLEHTGADAIMIGRAAMGRPWLFREIAHYLATGEYLPTPDVAEIHQILLEHLADLYSFYGEYTGVRMARKHISWYTKGLADSAGFRHAMNQMETTREQLEAANTFFLRAAERSRKLVYLNEADLAREAA
jgi:tRNA-dihydrouridine synthase B